MRSASQHLAMTAVDRQELGVLAKLVIAVFFLLFVAGVVWHGVTIQALERIWRNLLDRPTARMSFRFVLQPSMAAITAVYDGFQDARRNRAPFFRTILWYPKKRVGRLREGLNAIARLVLLCVAIDTVYQILELRTFHPNEALIVALLLALTPYIVIRGLATRILLRRQGELRSGGPNG
jgi:hypothetical protein